MTEAQAGLLMALIFWGGFGAFIPFTLVLSRWFEKANCKHTWVNISPEISGGKYSSVCVECHSASKKLLETADSKVKATQLLGLDA